jgi:hypothetical protein
MRKGFFINLLFIVGFANLSFSQSINTGILFNPGVTLGTEYIMPSAINDSTDFQLTKYNVQFSQPLKTKIGIEGLTLKDFSFKKLDAKASQLFLDYTFSVAQPTFTDNNLKNIYKAGIGLTAVTASARKGIWIYSAKVFASENEETLTKSFTPNFRGFIANVKTKNFKTFYFYGAGLLVNQGKLIPFPLLGLKTRFGSSNFRAELIIPLHAKLNYRFNNKVNIDAVVHFNGINTIYREGSAYEGNDKTLNFSQLKTYLALNSQLGKQYKLKIEGGYSNFQQIYSWENKTTQKIDPAPYVGISLTYSFGKSVFGNFVNQGD